MKSNVMIIFTGFLYRSSNEMDNYNDTILNHPSKLELNVNSILIMKV